MTFKCISDVALSWPQSIYLNMLDYSLQVCTIMDSKCILPNLLNYGLQVHLQTRSIMISECISKITLSWPLCVSPNFHICSLQVCKIVACKGIYALGQSWPQSASLCLLNHGILVYLQTRLITASNSKWICILAQSRPWIVSLCSLTHSMVKQWGKKADRLSSILCHTSHHIRKEFLTRSGPGSRSIRTR